MKKFALIAGAMLLCGSALAQPPAEVTADDTISLKSGQTKVVSFDQSVTEIRIAGGGTVARIRPITDRTFSIEGMASGDTLAIAYGAGGKEVHRFNIAVSGHMVKVYGQKPPLSKPGAKAGDEYDSFICTDTGCGRVNPDIVSGPSAAIISETQADKDGNSKTVTKEYR